MNAIKDHLSQAGLLNSSFGQQILASTGSAQSQDIAGIPAMDAQNFIRGGVGASTAATGQGVGATGTAAGITTNNASTQTESQWQALMQGVQLAATGKSGSSGGGSSSAGSSAGKAAGSSSLIGGSGSGAAAGAMAI